MAEKVYETDRVTLYQGDALEVLHGLPAQIVQTCCTSPPYWGLRNYNCKGQMGLEPSPGEYVEGMTAVFREVRRVLRDDGTLWLNMGDCYATNPRGRGDTHDPKWPGARDREKSRGANRGPNHGLKHKDLVGMPWMLAFALRDDGWYLRSDIIWYKRNSMPESVTDRPTTVHEHLFLLAKSERYYYDAEAIKERVTGNAHARGHGVNPKARQWKTPDGWDTSVGKGGHGSFHREGREKGKPRQNESFSEAVTDLVARRNKRTVWDIPTKPFTGAHFATYPPDLIEPCIKAGTSQTGACSECGSPWFRVVEKPPRPEAHDYDGKWKDMDKQSSGRRILANVRAAREAGGDHDNPFPQAKTVGWKSGCDCDAQEVAPCVVLDPFLGSGTTALVALQMGCRFIGIDLSGDCLRDIAIPRIEKAEAQPGLF